MRLAIIAPASALLALAFLWMSVGPGPVASRQPLEVGVFDGKTIEIGREVYTLVGIDAPELGQLCDANGNIQPCGLTAAYQLRKMLSLGKASLACQPVHEAEADAVASCAIGTQDVSLDMIQSGYALAKPDAPPHYGAAEATAREAGIGIWGSTFVPPERWRQGERLAVESDGDHQACMIKAIVADGRRLYYGPLDPGYEQIDIAAASPNGRTFCSGEEARAAGWQRPVQAAD